MRQLAWGRRVHPDFVTKVRQVCDNLGWPATHANWLMACIAFESGRTFSPSIKNMAGSGATGLIQFMPRTARGLGTSTGELAEMTAVEQLDWVEKYFQPYRRRINSISDMYMAILLPRYVGEPDNSVLFLQGTKAYRQNSGLDANKDGKVTKLEASNKVIKLLLEGMEKQNLLVEG